MPLTDLPAVRKCHPHFQPAAAVLPPIVTDLTGFAQQNDFAQKSGGLKQVPEANNPVQPATNWLLIASVVQSRFDRSKCTFSQGI